MSSSTTSNSSAAAKKKMDERNSKAVSELSRLPDNRFCFECGQRGPTYVNITEGSFCCSTCSGLLRGLNPPHRVKSISMATFSNEEVEKIRQLGNAENKKTWLGLYEGTPPKSSTRDEMQSFLIKKYEKKTWFVSRTELNEQERLFSAARERSSQGTASVTSETESQQANDLMNDPFSDAFAFTQNQSTNMPVPLSPPSQLAPPPPLFSTSPSNQFNQPQAKPRVPINLPQTSTAVFNDPFSPIETKKPLVPPTNPNQTSDPFADFDTLFGGLTVQKQQQPQIPRSQTVAGVPPRPQPQPVQVTVGHQIQAQPKSTPPIPISQPIAVDKYSALAELDQIFSSGSPSTPLNTNLNGQSPWISSAYGSKPTNGGNPFGQATPIVAPIQQPNPAQAWPNPFQAGNPFGGMNGEINPFSSNHIQKSSTVGAFSDLNSIQAFPHQQAAFGSNSQQFHEVNPFVNQFATPQPVIGQLSTRPIPSNMASNTQSTVNWNPFS